MHPAAYDWVRNHAKPSGRVLDIGGRDVNGTVRDLFGDDYTALDLMEGEGVDVVADVREYKDSKKFDVVVCCEVLEHVKDWRGILDAAARLIKKGGTLIVTAAGPGRAPHSAIDGAELRAGEYYGNVKPADLEKALAGWSKVSVDVSGPDVRAVAVK